VNVPIGRLERDLASPSTRAARLYRQARRVVIGRTIAGTLLGTLIAATLLALALVWQAGSGQPLPPELGPLCVGLILAAVLLGYWSGQLKALPLKIEAFNVLRQEQMDEDARRASP